MLHHVITLLRHHQLGARMTYSVSHSQVTSHGPPHPSPVRLPVSLIAEALDIDESQSPTAGALEDPISANAAGPGPGGGRSV